MSKTNIYKCVKNYKPRKQIVIATKDGNMMKQVKISTDKKNQSDSSKKNYFETLMDSQIETLTKNQIKELRKAQEVQLEVLKKELEDIENQISQMYYSSNATIDAIRNRTLLDLINIYLQRIKSKSKFNFKKS